MKPTLLLLVGVSLDTPQLTVERLTRLLARQFPHVDVAVFPGLQHATLIEVP